jgi:hypothetical protein
MRFEQWQLECWSILEAIGANQRPTNQHASSVRHSYGDFGQESFIKEVAMWSMHKLAIPMGAEVELMPNLLGNLPKRIARQCQAIRATIVNPTGGRHSVIWNNRSYSLSSLLNELWYRFGIKCVAGVCCNWRIVGHGKSIREEAG